MSAISDESPPPSREVKTTLTISIPPELKKMIEEDAAMDDRSVSNYVVRVLEKRHELTKTQTTQSEAREK